MVFSNWVARSLFKDSLFRTALAASFLFGSSAFGLHQLVQDRDFEVPKPKDTWKESAYGPFSKADSYFPGGYESDHCGFMDASLPNFVAGWPLVWAKLGQDVSKRKIIEITEFEWALKYRGRYKGFNSIEIIASAENDTLIYLYHRMNAEYLPQETEHTKIIRLGQIEGWWKVTTRMLGGEEGDWVNEGLPLEALLDKIEFKAVGHDPYQSPYGTYLYIDKIGLLSTRYDHDFGVLNIFMPDSVEVDKSYRPGAEVKNLGAFDEGSDVICNILFDDNNVYSDTARVDSLPVDSTRDVSFRNWMPEQEGLYLVNVYTALENEQNPENDSLSQAVNAYTGIEEMTDGPIQTFLAFPNPTRGLLKLKGSGQGFIELYDASGRLVNRVFARDSKLDLSGYSPGVYFMKGASSRVEKVVKVE